MKNWRILKILFISAGLLMACSEDFIDLRSPNEFTNEVALASMVKLRSALTGAYGELQGEGCYGEDLIGIPEAASDNLIKSEYRNSGRYQEWYAFKSTPASTASLTWIQLYKVITQADNIINAWPKADTLGVNEAGRNQIMGEALFLRAFGHFQLVNIFAQAYGSTLNENRGVPIVLETKIQKPARNTVEEVYTKVISDLEEAVTLMSWNAQNTPYFSTIDAANALLARVYLYKGDWANAAAKATLVINSGHYTLYTADEYIDSWTLDGSSESIFEIMLNKAETNFPGRGNTIGNLSSPNYYGDLSVNDGFYDFAAKDTADVRFKMLYKDDNDEYRHKKFPGKAEAETPEANNARVIRLSEMYLTRAEANDKNGTSIGDSPLNDINKIRENRGVAKLTAATINTTAIRNERRLELAFEGLRLFDLKRWGVGIDRSADCQLTSNCTISNDSYLLALPIPAGEIIANPNVAQNDGY